MGRLARALLRGGASRPRSRGVVASAFVGLVALAVLDLGTKEWALGALSSARLGPEPARCEPTEDGRLTPVRVRSRPVVLIDDYLELRYAENCGGAFGVLRGAAAPVRGAVFGAAAVVALLVLGALLVRGHGGALFAWAVPLVGSGAVGNLADRVRHGYVVDFIRFHVGTSFEWPTFNVADCGITVGVILLLADGSFERWRAARRPRDAAVRASPPGAGAPTPPESIGSPPAAG